MNDDKHRKVVSTMYTSALLMEKKIADIDIAIIATSKEDYDKKCI
jgi:hypothetical protein